jgi:signal transduction histidine kinase
MPSNRENEGQLLSLAVHEFRTPITVVAGYIRMLLKHYGGALAEQPREFLEEAEKSCGRLSSLVAELSDVAHLDDGRLAMAREEVPIFGLLAEVAASLHEGEDRDVRLRLVGTGTVETVEGDPGRLRKALQAVLAATLREYVEPGTVLVRGEVIGGAQAPAAGHAALALIVVGDPAAADPSYRFDPSGWGAFQEYRGGMGFGLPVARRVIEASGGRLWSKSDSERRAAIAMVLPVREKRG